MSNSGNGAYMVIKCLKCGHFFDVDAQKINIICPKCGSDQVDIIKVVT